MVTAFLQLHDYVDETSDATFHSLAESLVILCQDPPRKQEKSLIQRRKRALGYIQYILVVLPLSRGHINTENLLHLQLYYTLITVHTHIDQVERLELSRAHTPPRVHLASADFCTEIDL